MPFSTEETDLLTSARDEDMRAAASELAARPERPPGRPVHAFLRTVAEQISAHPPTTEAT